MGRSWPIPEIRSSPMIAPRRDAQAQGDPDRGDTYYVHWLTALERIATAKGCVTRDGLVKRRNAWDIAARRKPQGRAMDYWLSSRQ